MLFERYQTIPDGGLAKGKMNGRSSLDNSADKFRSVSKPVGWAGIGAPVEQERPKPRREDGLFQKAVKAPKNESHSSIAKI
jgi:hypothetical protein